MLSASDEKTTVFALLLSTAVAIAFVPVDAMGTILSVTSAAELILMLSVFLTSITSPVTASFFSAVTAA